MTLPANIRVNTLLPFPSLVMGSGPIGITKVNGVWTVSLSATALAVQAPTSGQQLTDYVMVWDSIQLDWFIYPLSSMTGSILPAPVQRSITSGPVTIQTTDRILNLNLSTPTSIPLPSYTTRNGVDLTFKDVGKQAATNNITLVPASGEMIDGFVNVVMNTNGVAVKLVPFTDGTNTGWSLQ